jgi:hypothetical protein
MSATEIAPTPAVAAPVTPAAPVAEKAAPPVAEKAAEPVAEKAGEVAPPAKELLKAPEIAAYDIKASEGADAELATSFAKEARASGLTAEKAQALYDSQVAVLQARATAQREQWLTESMKHPTLGGAKLEQSLKTANTALERFASPEFVSLLKQQGLDVHPQMLAAWHAVGVAISPDTKFVTGSPKTSVGDSAKAFYDNMPKA